MKRIILFILLSLGVNLLNAQVDTTYTPSEPKGGIELLALVFYTIEFTPEQREIINQRPVELFFFVSDMGTARLETVNGVRNTAIIDSLYSAGRVLPPFTPATRKGVAVQSLYSMELTFPSYTLSSFNYTDSILSKPIGKYKPTDFDTIVLNHNSFQMVFGGYVNGFTGRANDFLKTGGGFKIEMLGFGKNSMYYGMNMSFNGNKRKRDYLINDEREQNEAPPTLFLGGTVGKEVNEFLIQIDVNMVLQNIVSIDSDSEEEPVQFWGFSPGLLVNYPIPIGSRVNINYFNSAQNSHYLNLHAGYRQLIMGDQQGNGGMWEFGLSYRLGTQNVTYYKLHD